MNNDVTITGVDVYRVYVLPALGELIGTGLFVFFVNLSSAPSTIRPITYPVMSGISLYVLRGFFSKITPGYYNPAATVSQLVLRRLDVPSIVAYVVVQFFGAFLGAVLFRALVSDFIFVDYFISSYMSADAGSISRSQGFFLDVILSSIICLSYLAEINHSDHLRIPACWTLVSAFSFTLIGQSGNVALSAANALVYHIFTGNNSATANLYLHFSAAVIAVVLSCFIVWFLKVPANLKETKVTTQPEKRDRSTDTF